LVTDSHPEKLKALAHRDLLPFSLPKGDLRSSGVAYSPFWADLLVAQYALVDNGMAIESAARALRRRADAIAEGPLVIETVAGEKGVYRAGKKRSLLSRPPTDPRKDLWIGFAAKAGQLDDPVFLFGIWKEINAEMTSGLQALENEPGENFAALFMANFSQAQRIVRRRATANNIDLQAWSRLTGPRK
jgi:hypothetical protein